MCLAALVGVAACGDDGGSTVDAAPMNPPTKFVFLNFEGGTIETGALDPTRNMWPQPSQTFEPYQPSHPDRAQILDGIVAQTRELLAPYDIGVEKDRPAEKYMMIMITGLPENNGSVAGNGGDAAVTCGLSAFSRVISTQFQGSDEAAATVEQIINVHSFMTVAEIGIAHGIVSVTLPGNCMCWAANECFSFDYSMESCTIEGTATVDPNAQCPNSGTIDVGAEFLAKLKPHP